MELVASNGDKPRSVAIAALVFSAVTFVAMALYGMERWCDRGEAFSVYYDLFSRISPVCRQGDQLGLRRPLSGLAQLEPIPGTAVLLATIIGSVTFDGLAEAPLLDRHRAGHCELLRVASGCRRRTRWRPPSWSACSARSR